MSDTTPTETPASDRPSAGAARRRWRPRRLHWHLSIWTLVAAGLGAAFLALASMSLTGRTITLPEWAKAQVLDRMNAALPEGRLSLRELQFGVTPRGRPMLRLVDVGVRDATGLEIGRLNGVDGGFHLGAALVGRFEPTILRLTGAQVTLRRLADGTFALQMGQEGGTAGNLASLLDGVDALFTGGPLASTDRLEASDLTITLEDSRVGRLWQVTDGRLEILPGEQVIDTIVSFDVFNGTEELASTELSFRSARETSEASISARFENAAARDIAAQSPALAFLTVIDAPISGALRSTIDQAGGISDLAGAMQIGEGALSPTPGAPPARFDGAKIYIDFEPSQQRIDFQGFSVQSALGRAEAEGQVFLSDFRGGWPNALIGQITLGPSELAPERMFEAPLGIDRGIADLRVTLDPFRIDVGQAVLYRGNNRYDLSGNLGAGRDGWSVALDGHFDTASRAEILALWPVEVAAVSRKWVVENVFDAEAFDGTLAWRKEPGEKARMTGTFGLRDGRIKAIKTLPAIDLALGYATLGPSSFTAVADSATITAPDGTVMDLAGISYRIPDLKADPKEGVVRLAMSGPMPGALSLLGEPPFNIFKRNDYGPDLAKGDMQAQGLIRFPIVKGKIPPEDLRLDIRATLTDVSSDQVVKDKLLLADRLEVVATDTGVEISGPVRLGQATLAASWRLPMAAGKAGTPRVEGTIDVTSSSLREFGLGSVEDLVSGSTRARFALDFAEEEPKLTLSSDLAGLGMTIPGTGWRKPVSARGTLEVEARVGDRATVDRISIEASGLTATGSVTTAEGGGLGEATFDRVRIGGWLDAPVVLTGRGEGVPIAIAIPGGTIDMRRADLDNGSGGGTRAAGPRQPLTLALDRMIVSEGIRINNLRADLDLSGGMHGTFAGQIAGGSAISGTVATQAKGAAFRITSKDAGGVLRGANIFKTARGGDLVLILAPVGQVGTYEGEFTITDTRVVNAPAMAELLSAVSVVGLLDQAQGEGISFTKVGGRFRLAPNSVTLYSSSAVGPSMGISLDGYYDTAAGQIDMQGVLSPLYIVNALGRIFSPREGEGLVGFNFTLEGNVTSPEVNVNPLSILTPGVLREIFRRPAPTTPEE